jgi:hypothetical protein
MDTSLFTIEDTRIGDTDPVLCLLDTKEGSDCFGHWINECAVFLPEVYKLKHIYPTLKVVLAFPRRFKLNTLIDFGILESDILYHNKFSELSDCCRCEVWNKQAPVDHTFHTHVTPPISQALVFIPHYFFLNITSQYTCAFLKCVFDFKDFYTNLIGDVPKTIPIVYLIRSRKENYNSPNKRTFLNLDEMIHLCKKYSIYILDIDTLDSIRDQVEIVRRAEIVIHEYGAAMINSTYFGQNHHLLLLNHFIVGDDHASLMMKMLQINEITYDVFFNTSVKEYPNFSIDIALLEERLLAVQQTRK